MKNNKIKLSTVCAVAVMGCSVSGTALAYEVDGKGKWYLGAGAGVSSMSPEPRGSEYQDILKDGDTGFKVFGGYDITPNWAAEIYYTNLGSSEVDSTRTIANLPTPQARDSYANWAYAKKGEIGYESAGLTALWFPGDNNGHLSGGRFNYFLGAGLSYLQNKPLSNDENKKIKYDQDNAVSLMLTGGLEYEITNRFTGRLSVDSYDKDMNIALLSLMYTPGSKHKNDKPVQVVTPAAEPVPAVKPAPVVVEQMVQPEPVVADVEPVLNSADEVKAAVTLWARSWQNQNVNDYLASYVGGYRSVYETHAKWVQLRRSRLTKPSYIDVNLYDMNVEMIDATHAVATFRQDYKANTYVDLVDKELKLVKVDSRWLIQSEAVLNKVN